MQSAAFALVDSDAPSSGRSKGVSTVSRPALVSLWIGVLVSVLAAPAHAGVMAYWKFDETSGQTVADETGVNHGMLGNSTGADSHDPVLGQPGRFGTAFDFDGNSDYVLVPDDPSIGDNVQGGLTVSMWLNSDVRLDASSGSRRMLEKGDCYFLLQDLANGGMNFLVKQGGNIQVAPLNTSIEADRWYHLVGTYDGTEMRVYLDTNLQGTHTLGGPIDDDNERLWIGADDSNHYFDGRIDDVAIWDRALSQPEIQQLFTGTSPFDLVEPIPPITGVVTQATGRLSLADPGEPGRLVVEGEHYSGRQGGTPNTAINRWSVVPTEAGPDGGTHEGARGGEFVQVLPDSGTIRNSDPADVERLPYIEYRLQVAEPGDYQLYLRWDGHDGTSDSMYASLLGFSDFYRFADNGSVSNDSNFTTTPWHGSGRRNDLGYQGNPDPAIWTIPSAGEYILRLSPREDGVAVDSFVFQLASLAAPTGDGPAETGADFSPVFVASVAQDGTDADRPFPEIRTAGLHNGAQAYVDSDETWSGVPRGLLGADYILTRSTDAGDTEVDIEVITGGEDAFLYIFLDDRYLAASGVPDWMVDLGFIDNGFDIYQGANAFSILGTAAPADSAFRLGALTDPNASFYGIAASDFDLVPEPGTLALLGCGLAVLARSRRRGARVCRGL